MWMFRGDIKNQSGRSKVTGEYKAGQEVGDEVMICEDVIHEAVPPFPRERAKRCPSLKKPPSLGQLEVCAQVGERREHWGLRSLVEGRRGS